MASVPVLSAVEGTSVAPKSYKQNQKLLLFSPNLEFQSFELWSFKSVPEFVCSAYIKKPGSFGIRRTRQWPFTETSFEK